MSLFDSLEIAARMAVVAGNSVGDIRVEHWAATYRATVEDVRKAFEKAQAR